jgi:hypothetical protein
VPGGVVGEEETTTRDEEATGEASRWGLGNGKRRREEKRVKSPRGVTAKTARLRAARRVSACLCGLACGAAGLVMFNQGAGVWC